MRKRPVGSARLIGVSGAQFASRCHSAHLRNKAWSHARSRTPYSDSRACPNIAIHLAAPINVLNILFSHLQFLFCRFLQSTEGFRRPPLVLRFMNCRASISRNRWGYGTIGRSRRALVDFIGHWALAGNEIDERDRGFRRWWPIACAYNRPFLNHILFCKFTGPAHTENNGPRCRSQGTRKRAKVLCRNDRARPVLSRSSGADVALGQSDAPHPRRERGGRGALPLEPGRICGDEPPRVSERLLCSKPTRLFQGCSSVRRTPPPLLAAAYDRWRCVAARCYTS